jgi:hypothetical protein
MQAKIELMFAVAALQRCKVLVIEPWGSGAYGNPPEHVAELFAQAAMDFGAAFECIALASYAGEECTTGGWRK